jgi:flagellar protein FliJ
MTAFKSLTRVHSWALNEKRQKLAGIDELVRKMKKDLQDLENELEAENKSANASIEGTIAFPAFVAAALERRRRLRHTIGELEVSVQAAREEVHAAFEEMKKYEHAGDLEARKQQEESTRREQISLDDLGTDIYRRGQASGDE